MQIQKRVFTDSPQHSALDDNLTVDSNSYKIFLPQNYLIEYSFGSINVHLLIIIFIIKNITSLTKFLITFAHSKIESNSSKVRNLLVTFLELETLRSTIIGPQLYSKTNAFVNFIGFESLFSSAKL